MSKTIPQMLKIERRDDEHVAREHIEPYPWQQVKAAPPDDPFVVRTVPAARRPGAAPNAAGERTVPNARPRKR